MTDGEFMAYIKEVDFTLSEEIRQVLEKVWDDAYLKGQNQGRAEILAWQRGGYE